MDGQRFNLEYIHIYVTNALKKRDEAQRQHRAYNTRRELNIYSDK